MTFYILPATGVLMVAHIKDHPWSPIIFTKKSPHRCIELLTDS